MEHFTTLKNGKKVFVDLIGSHAATHLTDTPGLSDLVKEFLVTQSFTEPMVYVDHDTGTDVGKSDLVETDENDAIVYAKRLNRETYTRFVKNRGPIPNSYITVVLNMREDGNYELHSAWTGRVCPSFPGDPKATSESVPFWNTHALVWGKQIIQEGTETTISPWEKLSSEQNE